MESGRSRHIGLNPKIQLGMMTDLSREEKEVILNIRFGSSILFLWKGRAQYPRWRIGILMSTLALHKQGDYIKAITRIMGKVWLEASPHRYE